LRGVNRTCSQNEYEVAVPELKATVDDVMLRASAHHERPFFMD
jgi:hypothetical protein